jgi:hypothetical protein
MFMPRLAILVVIMCLLGCGPGAAAGDAGGDTSGCEPLSSAEVPPLDMPDVCTAYLGDSPTGTDVEVIITNAGDEAILLMNQSSGCEPPPQWFHVDGELEGHAVWLPTSSCHLDWPSCLSFTDGSSPCELCETLRQPIYIEPGGRFVTSWTAQAAIEVEFPATCSITGAAEQCWVPTALPSGTYQLRAFAGLASDCASADCSCEVDENGSCNAPDFPNESNLEATLAWSTECDVVEIAFEH